MIQAGCDQSQALRGKGTNPTRQDPGPNLGIVRAAAAKLWSFFQHPDSTPDPELSGGPKGRHLKGGHLKMGFRSEVRT